VSSVFIFLARIIAPERCKSNSLDKAWYAPDADDLCENLMSNENTGHMTASRARSFFSCYTITMVNAAISAPVNFFWKKAITPSLTKSTKEQPWLQKIIIDNRQIF
jgi:hypothetical protein